MIGWMGPGMKDWRDPLERCKTRHGWAHARVHAAAPPSRRARKQLTPLHDKITAWFEDWYRELQRQRHKAGAKAEGNLQQGSLVAHKEFTHVRHVAAVPDMQKRSCPTPLSETATTYGGEQ